MKPLVYLSDLIDNHKDKKYKRNQVKINKWTDEYAINLCSKVIIKDMVKYNENKEVFVVAEWCNTEYDIKTISDYITKQRSNKDLKSWGYKLPWNDENRIEELTDLLKLELEKHEEITCNYIIDKEKYSWGGCSHRYVKTLIVTMSKETK